MADPCVAAVSSTVVVMDRSFSGAVPTRDRELVEWARAKRTPLKSPSLRFLEEADSIFNSMGKRRTRVTSPLPGKCAMYTDRWCEWYIYRVPRQSRT